MSPGMKFFFSRIFPLIFVLVGAGTGFFGIRQLIRAKASVNWPVVQGQVIVSSVERHVSHGKNGSSTTYHAKIRYEFTIDGVVHTGTRVAYGDYGSSNSSHARKIVNRYPSGKKVTVHYMRGRPDECLLEPGMKGQAWAIPGFGLIFFMAGCAAAILIPKALRKQEIAEKERQNRKGSFDPSQSGDPIAAQIEWTPAQGGGTNIQTRHLVGIHSGRLEFRASAGAKVLYFFFLLVGLGVLIFFSIFPLLSHGRSFNMGLIIPLIIGLVFTGVGIGLLCAGTAPIVFDKKTGYFWKGRKAPTEVYDKSVIKHCVRLDEIHALQLISEYCSGNKNSFYSYELNLVLKDGRRINVVDHGDQARLRKDTDMLALFLGKPVWDAI